MKQIGIYLLTLLLALTLAACGTEELPTQTAREPEAVTERQPEKLAAEVPVQQTEEAVPEEKIGQKLLAVSICPCMAREHAQWDLSRWGYDGYDGEPINSELLAFRTYLTGHYGELTQTYGELLDGTVWILDSDGTYAYLQIIAIDADSARQLVLLRQDGDTVDVAEGTKALEGYVAAPCAAGLSDEEQQNMQTHAAVMTSNTEIVLFYRVSALKSNRGMAACFFRRTGDTDIVRTQIVSYYINGIAEGSIPLSDIPEEAAPALTPELDAILQKLDYHPNEADEFDDDYDEALLRRDLLLNWEDRDAEPFVWDDPVYASSFGDTFYMVKTGIQNLQKEMDLHPELKKKFESMPTWKLEDVVYGSCSIVGTTPQNETLTARASYWYVLVDGYTTSYQQKIKTLAEEGENSDQIPEAVKQEFVDFLPEYAYGTDSPCVELAGLYGGTAAWTWSIADNGNVRLEVVFTPDGVQIISSPTTIRFERDADGAIKQVVDWN